MASHTKGPWRANGRDVETDHARQVVPYVIAKTGAYLLTGSDPLGVPEANARLIAAAPTMLAALKMVEDNPGLTEAANDVIKAAIRKADDGA